MIVYGQCGGCHGWQCCMQHKPFKQNQGTVHGDPKRCSMGVTWHKILHVLPGNHPPPRPWCMLASGRQFACVCGGGAVYACVGTNSTTARDHQPLGVHCLHPRQTRKWKWAGTADSIFMLKVKLSHNRRRFCCHHGLESGIRAFAKLLGSTLVPFSCNRPHIHFGLHLLTATKGSRQGVFRSNH